ncbi:MAG: hypothetical protein VYA82_02230, partial [Pseudomonadota bacterium]|nr:hypothetical protein [Pseudomonadota bacterium]
HHDRSLLAHRPYALLGVAIQWVARIETTWVMCCSGAAESCRSLSHILSAPEQSDVNDYMLKQSVHTTPCNPGVLA